MAEEYVEIVPDMGYVFKVHHNNLINFTLPQVVRRIGSLTLKSVKQMDEDLLNEHQLEQLRAVQSLLYDLTQTANSSLENDGTVSEERLHTFLLSLQKSLRDVANEVRRREAEQEWKVGQKVKFYRGEATIRKVIAKIEEDTVVVTLQVRMASGAFFNLNPEEIDEIIE